MPIPKTNLFRGDRVKLSKEGHRWMVNSGLYSQKTLETFKTILGKITCDTLDPRNDTIKVKWDGIEYSKMHLDYLPDELELVEEDDEPYRKANTRKSARNNAGPPQFGAQNLPGEVARYANCGDSAGT